MVGSQWPVVSGQLGQGRDQDQGQGRGQGQGRDRGQGRTSLHVTDVTIVTGSCGRFVTACHHVKRDKLFYVISREGIKENQSSIFISLI